MSKNTRLITTGIKPNTTTKSIGGVLVVYTLAFFSFIVYTYAVSAYDAAGNESGQSSPVSATTQPAQQIVSLEPVADTYVAGGDQKNINFGSATKLRVYAWVIEPLLRFDLSSIPANATILSADFSVVFESYDYEDFDPKMPQRNFTIYFELRNYHHQLNSDNLKHF